MCFPCYFHPYAELTNMCLNKECAMPLCPECIKAHTNQHIQQKEEIHYETLTEAMRLVKSSLSECGNRF